MPLKLTERRIDHNSRALPKGVYALAREDGTIASYKVRWREESEEGVRRNAGKSFSIRKFGSLDRALEAARAYREEAINVVERGEAVLRVDRAASLTVDELFQEWCVKRGPSLSKRYAEDAVKRWDREIAPRSIARVRLDRLSRDPSILTRLQDELEAEGMTAANRVQVLKLLRAVLRWGRRRHPNALTVELSGLFELPSQGPKRLAYAADAYGLERIIEAVLKRPARNPLLPARDAALVASMGFTVAARPSEWLYSVTWSDVHERSVELQRPDSNLDELDTGLGLKTGARAALLLPNARDRLLAYREGLEARYGAQPDRGLVFQALAEQGPLWWLGEGNGEPAPVPWSQSEYKRWTARVWRPAREVAAQVEGSPAGLRSMRFYDCRHTAISMALHSTLVVGRHGMNLHNLAGWTGHDVQTLQRHYAHSIARYEGSEPIDLERECELARTKVEADPFKPSEPRRGPQREAQRRRRARARPSRATVAPR
jgi:hypothetical protein